MRAILTRYLIYISQALASELYGIIQLSSHSMAATIDMNCLLYTTSGHQYETLWIE